VLSLKLAPTLLCPQLFSTHHNPLSGEGSTAMRIPYLNISVSERG